MRVKEVEDGPVARAKVAAAAVEAEPHRPPWLLAAEPQFQEVLETARLQHELVRRRGIELPLGEEVRDLERREAALPEPLENVRQLLFRNPNTKILYRSKEHPILLHGFHNDGLCLGRIFDCIGEQIGQNLPDPVAICHDGDG